MKFLRISRVKMNYFSEPYTHNKHKVKDELDFLIMQQNLAYKTQ